MVCHARCVDYTHRPVLKSTLIIRLIGAILGYEGRDPRCRKTLKSICSTGMNTVLFGDSVLFDDHRFGASSGCSHVAIDDTKARELLTNTKVVTRSPSGVKAVTSRFLGRFFSDICSTITFYWKKWSGW